MTRAMFALTVEEREWLAVAVRAFAFDEPRADDSASLLALATRLEGEPDALVDEGWSGGCATCGTCQKEAV